MKKLFALMAAMILLISGSGSAETSLVESEDTMANIPQVNVGGVVYNLKDTEAREQISDLNAAFNAIENLNGEIELTWAIGGLTNDGAENTNTNRIRTGFVNVSDAKSLRITIASGYQANVFRFRTDKSLIGASSWISNDTPITVNDLGYVRIAVKRNDDADMSIGEGENITLVQSTEFLETFEAINSNIEAINSNIEAIDGNIELIFSDYYRPGYDAKNSIAVDFTANKFWDLSGETAVQSSHYSYQASLPIPVTPGDYYQIYASSGGSLKVSSWAIVDANYKILATGKKSAQQYTETDEFIVPSGGRYLVSTTMVNLTNTKLIKGTLIPNQNQLFGKTIAIIGDSISTNGNSGTDSNVPEIIIQDEDVGVELSAYLTYYDVQAGLSLGGHTFTSTEIGTEVTFTPTANDVGKVVGLPNNYNENTVTTWWEVLQEKTKCKCIPNTWSGSSVTSHEGNSAEYKTSYGWHEATIRKCGIRIAGTMQRTAPDLIIIYRGTNDFSHSPYALLTDEYFDNLDWDYPTSDEIQGGYGYKEGIALMIKKLRATYPTAKIFLCTLNIFKRVNYSHFPTNNGINSLPQYNNAIREVADFFGCGLIEFDKDGITFENCYSEGYIVDSATIPTHPSDKGHKVMGLKALKDIEAQYSDMN